MIGGIADWWPSKRLPMLRADLTMRLHAEMRSAIRRALALLILAAVPGCDNVDWGGAEFAVVKPPPQALVNPRVSSDPEADQLPIGPVLYHVVRAPSSTTASLRPIAEVVGDSLHALTAARDPAVYSERFVADFLRPRAEFILFNRGERAGLFVLDTARADVIPGCGPAPSATGTVQVDDRASGVTEFLAFARLHAPDVSRRIDADVQPTQNMPVLAPMLAEQMLRSRRAPLPGDWRRAMAQLVAFPVTGAVSPGFVSTFVVGDTLGPGLDNEGYALLYIASPASAQVGWDTVYVDFRDYDDGGKEAPKLVDFIDWNRDDQVDLLLHVFGVNDAWFEAMSRSESGEWRRVFMGRCASAGAAPETSASPTPEPAQPVPEQIPPDSAGTDTTTAAATAPPDTGSVNRR